MVRGQKTQAPDPNQEIATRVDRIEQTLQEGMDALKKQITLLRGPTKSSEKTSEFSDILGKMTDLETSMKTSLEQLKTEIANVQSQILHLNVDMQRNKQEYFHDELVFYGINDNDSRDLNNEICNIINNLVLNSPSVRTKVTEDDICYSYRLGKQQITSKNARPVVVHFVNRWKRDLIFHNKKNLKDRGIVIGERLCADKLDLFKKVRAKLGPKFCWTWRGNVYISKTSDGTRKLIKSENDLSNI